MKKIPLTLALLASLAMVAPCLAQAAPPPKAPPVDERLAALETRLAALEAKCSTCPCCCQVGVPAGSTVADPVGDVVQHADGSYWIRSCGPAGCREYPYHSVNSYGVAYSPMFYSAGGNCTSGSCGPGGCGGGGPMMGGCASGNCGGGGCASGNCGGGGRGRRGRR